MDSAELPQLPVSLSLGTQLPSSFNANEHDHQPQNGHGHENDNEQEHSAQPFQGFSAAIGDIDHGLPTGATFSTVAHPPQPSAFNPADSANDRYDMATPSRTSQQLRRHGKNGAGLQVQGTEGAHMSHAFNSNGDLDWVPASLSSMQNAPSNGRFDPAQVGSNDSETAAEVKDSHLGKMKIVPNPPNLDVWRERMFNVDGPITLTQEQFQTYFPHIDNVYSHRSTQKYKRKPFVCHYWDCRLKGRPAGTPKSDDPNKKKRKRVARERDLCDVKIKITEYFPEAVMSTDSCDQESVVESLPSENQNHQAAATLFFTNAGDTRGGQPFGVLTPSPAPPGSQSIARGQRIYTIQRVNGSGGNGKTGVVGGGHRHTLEDSDRVKKNSVHRYFLKKVKGEKRETIKIKNCYTITVPALLTTISPLHRRADGQKQPPQMKISHKQATGEAQETVRKHSRECEVKLYGSCTCPLVQRIWIALEFKGISYEYIEVDPSDKPPDLLKINPRGTVPSLLHGNWGCHESEVLLEYLEDLDEGPPLLPPGDAKLRAHCRLWADHIDRHIVPNFYKVLMERDSERLAKSTEELKEEIAKLVNASHVHGPFFLGPSMSYVDIQLAPWVIRLSWVLKPYRGCTDLEMGTRWSRWVEAIEKNEHVVATTSSPELYLNFFGRYIDERSGVSHVPNAVSNAISNARNPP